MRIGQEGQAESGTAGLGRSGEAQSLKAKRSPKPESQALYEVTALHIFLITREKI
jgi:hypothetical protein